MTRQVVDAVAVDRVAVRVYGEGWQSWTPTYWTAPGGQPRPATEEQRTMRFRASMPPPDDGWQGEGLLVVDPGTGDPCRLYADSDAEEAVTSIRARLRGDRLEVEADADLAPVLAHDPVGALAGFGEAFARSAGVASVREPPRVWCSWYHYFEQVTAEDIRENAAAIERHALPVDVVQLDDGWSHGLGEWLRPTDGFPSLARLVEEIRAGGLRAGIWLAPFMVGVDSSVAREHPDWLLGGTGFNWGQEQRGLDVTHPAVREYLHTSVRQLRDLGVDYFKLDFLYAGATPGHRHEDVSDVAAYRSGLRLLRDAAGEDAFLLGCGAPVLPSVGIVDAMRVASDTFHEGGEDGAGGPTGRPSVVGRAWQQGRLWITDPDCLVVRPSYPHRGAWAETVARFGGSRSFSDRIDEVDDWGLATLREVLPGATAEPFAADVLRASLEESR
ncbi:glycoside hydrolase [Nocardioides gansuensis]|uniref:Glycoside hydrolase n=1 Tax=Nocardioides gansuensis TaxID=2138300 RepID=A0A2T8FDX4_9ACTN|nr:glycoside hydrolase family 36 protein [Nocardioides gansuensis]PVG83918.1 glycoside hydrolase [Nocardioides gansuensis]